MRELALALGFYPVVALDVRWSERIFKDRWWKRKKERSRARDMAIKGFQPTTKRRTGWKLIEQQPCSPEVYYKWKHGSAWSEVQTIPTTSKWYHNEVPDDVQIVTEMDQVPIMGGHGQWSYTVSVW